MNRIGKVVQLQLVMKQTFVWMPLIILGGAFALSLAVFALIPSDGIKWSGASQAPLWYFLAIGVMALTNTFPFSQALSVTRREYLVGTVLTAAITAVGLALVFVGGGMLEQATNGWGVNGRFFSIDVLWLDGPFVAGVAYLVIALLFFVTGVWAATIYKRFGPMGLALTGILVAAALAATALIVTRINAWPAVGRAIVAAGVPGMTGVGAVLLVALILASYATLRRAQP